MNTINLERDILTEQVLDATTLPEITAAKQALRDWIKAHPEDAGMRDAFEQLYLLEEIALSQQAKANCSATSLDEPVSSS